MTSRPSLVDKAGKPNDEPDALAGSIGYFKLDPLNGNDTSAFIRLVLRDQRGKTTLTLQPGEVEELAEAMCNMAPLVIELVVKGLLENKLSIKVGWRSGGSELVDRTVCGGWGGVPFYIEGRIRI